ncbi:hypothetical protein C2S52_013429 [Perilla frutescens var. hirtella]|nr:hypothetical protein C2S51_015727 [Perilla frutescens var. frutescens]KAH6775868.1 hypothetical protein C2S52_013429 [Perilla frutescens var. hirtella]
MLLQFLNFGAGLQFLNPKNAHFPKRIPISSSSSSVRCGASNGLPVHDVASILHNKVLVSVVVSAAIGQLTKPFASTILYGKKFDLKTAFHAGGFPSTHSSAAVATATCLAIERGFADTLFGLAVVYAGLIMYDAQGVRREVGTHAKVLNKVMPATLYSPSPTNDANGLLNSYSRESSSDLEITDPVSWEEHSSFQKNPTSSTLLKSGNRVRIKSSGVVSDISVVSSLKESVGHTEIEVAAGALLGLVVSLVISPYL